MLTLNDGRKELYQWDSGRTATVDIECDIVHFANLKYGESLAVEVKVGEVAIPNKLLMSGEPIYCWAFVKDEDGAYTKKEQALDVIKRAKPSDYVYTETEVITVKTAVEKALEEAKESGEFKGEKGETGATGADGTSVTVSSVSESTADDGKNIVTFSDGKILTVKNGSKGSRGEKGEPADVKQTTGQSTTAVMSQKATTDEIDALKDDIFYLRGELYGTAINIKDLSLFDKINAFATSAGAWSQVGNTQYEAVVIPVPVEGCSLKMTGNNLYGTYYIGAKTLTTPSELSPIDLSADWNNRKYANPNESIEVTIPSDASYVLIWVKIDNVDCSPSNFAITKGGSSGDIQQIEEIAKGVVIIDVDLSNAKDGYVDANNNIFDTIGQTYNYKYCIKRNIVAGDVVTLDSNWTIAETIYAIAKIVNGVITGVVHGVSGANIYSWIADTDCDVIFSFRGDKINTANIKTSTKNQLLNIDNRTTELEKKVYKDDTDYMYMFRKIGMIGDSLGSGEITWLDEQGVYHGLDIFTNSWCYYICKSIGADVVHYSKGGASLSSWFNDFSSKLATDEPCNAYYIALGTNDANASDFNIGTINDTTTMETYTGRMKKLIEYVHQYAPHAVIFLMTMYGNVGTNPQLINAMIPQIADLYDYVYCIDFVNESDILKTVKDNDFTSEYHFTTNGYLRVANNIKRITNDVIRKNQTDFKYFAVNN